MLLLKSDITSLQTKLLSWFRATKRDLPWRQTYDPYHVWISEIMLQQTQMDRGVKYFKRWVERFPSVVDVAKASEDEILKYWEGLGYYARARNLHKAAKEIVEHFSSVVPADYQTLLQLPGIGPYTAAAIASIAGNQDVVVVDANVNRIFARLLDIEEPVKNSGVQKLIRRTCESLLPKGKARSFNQALMDLGGLVCTPKQPSCSTCILQKGCQAFANGTVLKRPVLKAPAQTVYVARSVAVIVRGRKVYMQKRKKSAVWGGLWEFPGGQVVVQKGEEAVTIDLAKEVKKDSGLEVLINSKVIAVSHQYTHHKIELSAYHCSLENSSARRAKLTNCTQFRWLTLEELDEVSCNSGVRKVINFIKESAPEIFRN